jgi:hypothetical protein
MGQYFKLHGLAGFFIAVALLLTILVFLTVNAIAVQDREASNFYKINDPYGLTKISVDNEKHLEIVGGN